MRFGLAALFALLLAVAVPRELNAHGAPAPGPTVVVDQLLAADRHFSERAAGVDTASAIVAMLDDDVIMPLPNARFARGRAEAAEALRSNPFNLTSRAEWHPLRGGVSADGEHGFTFGYMTIRGHDGEVRQAKYLAYWIRTAAGWRVAAYKRAARPVGEVEGAMMVPALPDRLVEPTPATSAAFRESLMAAELRFSNEAQSVGLRTAFQQNGSEDAINLGGGPMFLVGAQAIGAGLPDGPSPVRWQADGAIVASSGDLGVTWGLIRSNDPAQAQPPSPFFTIWRRASPAERWLYVAE